MNKIISFSVWGTNPQYCVGAIKNIEIARDILPDWKCRIFVNHTVPKKYINIYQDFDNVELAEVEDDTVYGMFWRFYSMFESEDNICISRDADSRLQEREVRCIEEWINSDKKFSIIRDHHQHYNEKWPIFGGMWGMKGKLNEKSYDLMIKYSKYHQYVMDQEFLRDVVWPIAKDDHYYHGYKDGGWFGDTRDEINFIGQGYTHDDNPLYSSDPSGARLI